MGQQVRRCKIRLGIKQLKVDEETEIKRIKVEENLIAKGPDELFAFYQM